MSENKTSGLAITSFVLGILSYFISILYIFIFPLIVPILSIIFGIFALRDIKRNNKSGNGLAIAGISISAIILFVVIVILIIGSSGGFDIWT